LCQQSTLFPHLADSENIPKTQNIDIFRKYFPYMLIMRIAAPDNFRLFFLSLSLYTVDISGAKPIAQICLPKKQKEHYYDEKYI